MKCNKVSLEVFVFDNKGTLGLDTKLCVPDVDDLGKEIIKVYN